MISINFGRNIHPANNAIIFIKLLIKPCTQLNYSYPFVIPPTVCSYNFFFFNLPSFLSSFQPTSIRDLGKNSVQSLSHIWLCDRMDCNTPGFPVHHQVAEFTQTHVDWVGDAIQPSHPLSSPFPPALNLFQHQGLFKWISSSD